MHNGFQTTTALIPLGFVIEPHLFGNLGIWWHAIDDPVSMSQELLIMSNSCIVDLSIVKIACVCLHTATQTVNAAACCILIYS